jgi:hypothetical protein
LKLIRTAGLQTDAREPRYGVFLRPDAATAWALTQLTFALQQQFGLVSAAAFPPHATLVGNLALHASGDTAIDQLVAALDPVFAATGPVTVANRGIERTPSGMFEGTFRCNIDDPRISDLAAQVKAAVLPLSRPVTDYFTVPVADYEFHGHLSVVSHELALDPRLRDEVADFLAELPIAMPSTLVAEWFTLVELRADWAGPWWEDQSWRHIRSWHVTAK